MNLSHIRHLLFDLGGVIINLEVPRTHQALGRLAGRDAAEIARQSKETDLFSGYETGACTDDEFRRGLRSFLNATAPDDQLDAAWNAMLLDLPPARVELLRQLRGSYTLLLLSNTNDIHLREVNAILRQSTGVPVLEDLFDRTYYSQRIGLSKPGAASFRYVLDHAGIAAADTLFLDDSPENLRGAQQLGIHTVLIGPSYTILDLFADAPTKR
ncbi:MAG: HAD family phosphatase [Cytophagales bacterium]|nr:HAD family phosphatase [Cytophagales bacterium]